MSNESALAYIVLFCLMGVVFSIFVHVFVEPRLKARVNQLQLPSMKKWEDKGLVMPQHEKISV